MGHGSIKHQIRWNIKNLNFSPLRHFEEEVLSFWEIKKRASYCLISKTTLNLLGYAFRSEDVISNAVIRLAVISIATLSLKPKHSSGRTVLGIRITGNLQWYSNRLLKGDLPLRN